MSKKKKTTNSEKIRSLVIASGRYFFWLGWPAIWMLSRLQKNRSRVVVRSGHKILLVKSWLGPRHWELPGGGLHAGEDPQIGALRELQEEAGLTVKPSQLVELGVFRNLSQSGMAFHCHAFLVRLPSVPELKLQRWEIIDAQWLELDRLPSHSLDGGTREIINRAVHYTQA